MVNSSIAKLTFGEEFVFGVRVAPLFQWDIFLMWYLMQPPGPGHGVRPQHGDRARPMAWLWNGHGQAGFEQSVDYGPNTKKQLSQDDSLYNGNLSGHHGNSFRLFRTPEPILVEKKQEKQWFPLFHPPPHIGPMADWGLVLGSLTKCAVLWQGNGHGS